MKRARQRSDLVQPEQKVDDDLMLTLCVQHSGGPDRFTRHAEVMAAVGVPWPDPPITVADMQSVTFAAKMALIKVLLSRKQKAKRT